MIRQFVTSFAVCGVAAWSGGLLYGISWEGILVAHLAGFAIAAALQWRGIRRDSKRLKLIDVDKQ